MASEIEDPAISHALTAVLRAVRKHRGLTSKQVAERMTMKLRTYQHFEAGGGRFSFPKLRLFAEATGSDFNGLTCAILVGDTNLATCGADNRLVTITLFSLKALSGKLGRNLSSIEPRVAIGALDQAFGQMENQMRGRLDVGGGSLADGSQPAGQDE
ncbi:helix-turn-helix transcriptional regulator [Phenylobacterium sp.]|uniref:helix-turn-helix domain-containing protein n=1 Tax=Phenylobacterium sp. TaxID=1871053 RepID=UPI002730DA47|nr:helix-turn-helix transcriptional regulator [Phenylobacterium sp.]MDP1598833.1 helix-turn-helix transcriptional regulator [Phenylobacterium sp.]MDP3592016.1 helix-turn-helix transcriptional regulator [Phenylobacterium sp.]